MKINEALEYVFYLAEQNVLEERDTLGDEALEQERSKQLEALEIAAGLFRAMGVNPGEEILYNATGKFRAHRMPDNSYIYVTWDEIERVIGTDGKAAFSLWMAGQTVPTEGVYVWDLDRYLARLPIID